MGAEVGVFALVTFLAARLGDASLAAHNLALTLASFSFSIQKAVTNGTPASTSRRASKRLMPLTVWP